MLSSSVPEEENQEEMSVAILILTRYKEGVLKAF